MHQLASIAHTGGRRCPRQPQNGLAMSRSCVPQRFASVRAPLTDPGLIRSEGGRKAARAAISVDTEALFAHPAPHSLLTPMAYILATLE